MKTFICRILILTTAIFGLSCQIQPGPKMAPVSNDPVIAKAGWKIGQVYKTLKPGRVVKHGNGQLALNTENSNSMVEEAWQSPGYRNGLFAYRVEPGTLFQVTEVRLVSVIYTVFAKKLPFSPKSKMINMNLFEGGSDTLIGEHGFIIPRDPNYLIPVEIPVESNQTTKNTTTP